LNVVQWPAVSFAGPAHFNTSFVFNFPSGLATAGEEIKFVVNLLDIFGNSRDSAITDESNLIGAEAVPSVDANGVSATIRTGTFTVREMKWRKESVLRGVRQRQV